MSQILDQEDRCYVDAELAGYEDVYVTVESACTDNGETLLLGGGYDFRWARLPMSGDPAIWAADL